MSQLFLIFCMPKKKIYIVLMSQNIIQIVKKQVIPKGEGRHYLVVKKTVSIIKRNNVQTRRWLLLSELPSFFCNRKQSRKKVCERSNAFYRN